MRKTGFTLIEIIVVFFVVALVSGVAYKLMTGTFSQFFKSQTKLTNLRGASLILERLKADMRRAVLPVKTEERPVIEINRLKFCIYADGQRKMVDYAFSGNTLKRIFDGGSRNLGLVHVSDFSVTRHGEDSDQQIAIKIIVDQENDSDNRSSTSAGNKVELRAVLYPRFFVETISDEERYWNLARYGAGGN